MLADAAGRAPKHQRAPRPPGLVQDTSVVGGLALPWGTGSSPSTVRPGPRSALGPAPHSQAAVSCSLAGLPTPQSPGGFSLAGGGPGAGRAVRLSSRVVGTRCAGADADLATKSRFPRRPSSTSPRREHVTPPGGAARRSARGRGARPRRGGGAAPFPHPAVREASMGAGFL